MEKYQNTIFERAFTLAKENCLSDALFLLFGEPRRSHRTDQLKALCLWRIGYFKWAGHYSNEFMSDAEAFTDTLTQIKPLLESRKYMDAAKIIDIRLPETVIRHQLSGCLLCLAGLPGHGKARFFDGLALDRFNHKTIQLIQMAQETGGGGIAEFIRSVGYRFRRGQVGN